MSCGTLQVFVICLFSDIDVCCLRCTSLHACLLFCTFIVLQYYNVLTVLTVHFEKGDSDFTPARRVEITNLRRAWFVGKAQGALLRRSSERSERSENAGLFWSSGQSPSSPANTSSGLVGRRLLERAFGARWRPHRHRRRRCCTTARRCCTTAPASTVLQPPECGASISGSPIPADGLCSLSKVQPS